MDTTQKIKALIAKNKTKKAISELSLLTQNTDLHNEVIQQSANFAHYEREKRIGKQSAESLNLSLRQIHAALLSILEELPESTILPSNKSNWQKYLAIAAVVIVVFGSLAEILHFINIIPNQNNNTTKTVTILVHGKKGKDDIILPNRGIVELIYGTAKIPEQINNEGEVTFKQIPARFFAPEAKVEILFKDPEGEKYRVENSDSLYDLKENAYIALTVVLEGIAEIDGIVKDFETGEFIDSARVAVFGNETYSNKRGEFTLEIPEKEQRSHITLNASKEGYQLWEMKGVPTTNRIVIPLKKE